MARDHRVLWEELLALNPYEQLGQESMRLYGEPLSYGQFLYLCVHAGQAGGLAALHTPAARREQQALHERFRQSFGGVLPESGFFTEGKRMEMQKWLRYVEIPAHKHEFLEFTFVLSGTCTHKVGQSTYNQGAGSCCAIAAGIEHLLVPSPDCVCLTIKVRRAVFDKMNIPNMPYFVYPISFQTGDDPFVRHTLLTLYEQQEDALPYSDQIFEQLFQVLMTYILQNYRDTLQHLTPHYVKSTQMLEILNYVFENYQVITLQALAGHFHFNASYLSGLIHQQTGSSFSAILREFKLRQAARLLTESKLPLNQICEEVGYKDTSQFIRNFKEAYGATPMQYRRKSAC